MKKIIVIIFLLLFLGINAYSKTGVSERDMNMIRIAFMNGAVELTKLDLKQIQELKNNNKALRSTVTALTNNYLKQVQKLNFINEGDQINSKKNYYNH